MAKITALRENKGRRRISVFLDGRFAFSLSADLALSEGLYSGQILAPEQIDSLSKSDQYKRCLAAATNYLSYRPRSASELRTLLQRRGYDTATQESVISSLKENGLIDDAAFAEFWTENRVTFSPRSQRLTRIELQKKGVARDVIERAVSSVDDQTNAYRAASDHVRSIRWSDRDQFRRRMGGYLQRRGFAYSTIESTLARVWKEVQSEADSDLLEYRTDLKEGR
jgi:regulatory protein